MTLAEQYRTGVMGDFEWYAAPRTPRGQAYEPRPKGRGLQVERPDEWARTVTPTLFTPEGTVEQPEVWINRPSHRDLPLTMVYRMPIVFRPCDFDTFPDPSQLIAVRSAYLQRRNHLPAYFPVPQDQSELYHEPDGLMKSWRAILIAVEQVWRVICSRDAGYWPGVGVGPRNILMTRGPVWDPQWMHSHEPFREGRPGTYAFQCEAGLMFLHSEQVERAVRWYHLPETVKLT